MEARWQVDDGYAGGARPQHASIDIDEMAESCETEAEALDYLHAEIQREFENRITWYINNQDEVIEAWRERRATADASVAQEENT